MEIIKLPTHLKFIYSEKATKFCEISTVDLSYVVPVKSTVEISRNFVAFSEYMNFTLLDAVALVDWPGYCQYGNDVFCSID